MGTFPTSPSPLSAGAPSPIGGPIKSGPILLPTIYILRNPRNSSSLILLPTSRHPLTRQPSALQSASPIPLRPFLSRTGAARPHSADSAVRTGTAPPPHAASQPRTRRALHSTPVLGFHRPHATRTRSTPPRLHQTSRVQTTALGVGRSQRAPLPPRDGVRILRYRPVKIFPLQS